MGSRTQRELAFLLTGKDVSASKAMRGVNKEVGKLGKIAGKAGGNVAKNLERGLVIAGGAAAGAIGYAAKAAIDWEDAFAGVRKTVDATPAELDAMAEAIRRMSTQMPIAATDLAAIAENAGALGIKKGDIIGFTKTVAILATTTNVTADDAATALGQLSNILGLTGKDYDNFAATLVDLGNKGASTEAQILEITRRSGGAAHLIGLAARQTLAWSSAAANLGINEELAGTSLQNFFLKTQSVVGGGGKHLQTLAKIAGRTSAQFKKDFEKDASGALETLLKGLKKLPKAARLQAIQDVFGKGTGLTRLIIGLSDSLDANLVPSLDNADKAWKANTAATDEAKKRFATTASQIQIFKNNIQDAAVTIGTELLPIINDLSKQGVDWLTEHHTDIAQFAKDLATGIKDAVSEAKKLDWGAIASALHSGVGAVEAIGKAFLALPAPVQALLAGGFAANKLTGGAVQDLAKLGLQIVFERGSSPANPLWVQSVGGGPGGLPGGAAGAAGGGVAALLGTFAVAGIAGEVGYQLSTAVADGFQGIAETLVPGQTALTDAVGDAIKRNRDIFLPGFDTLNHLDQIPGQIDELLHGKPTAPAPGPRMNGDILTGTKEVTRSQFFAQQKRDAGEAKAGAHLQKITRQDERPRPRNDVVRLSPDDRQAISDAKAARDPKSEANAAAIERGLAAQAQSIFTLSAALDTSQVVDGRKPPSGMSPDERDAFSAQTRATANVGTAITSKVGELTSLEARDAAASERVPPAVSAAQAAIQAGDSRSETRMIAIAAAAARTAAGVAAGDSHDASRFGALTGAVHGTTAAVHAKRLSVTMNAYLTSTTSISGRDSFKATQHVGARQTII